MKIIVTGGRGFIGQALIGPLSRGNELVAVSRSPPVPLDEAVAWERCDLLREGGFAACFRKWRPEVVVHLASPRGRITEATLGDFRRMTALLRKGLEARRPRRLVAIGSADEYGDAPAPQAERGSASPSSVHGKAKLDATQSLLAAGKDLGIEVVVLRPFLVYGPNQAGPMFIPSCIRALSADQRFAMSPGQQRRDLIFVDDVASAIMLASLGKPARTARAHGIYNVCTGIPVSVLEIATQLHRLVGRGRLDVGATPYRPGEPMELVGDPASMLAEWGFRALVPWREGLRRTVEAAKSRGTH